MKQLWLRVLLVKKVSLAAVSKYTKRVVVAASVLLAGAVAVVFSPSVREFLMQKIAHRKMVASLDEAGIMSKNESAAWIKTAESTSGFLDHENFLKAYSAIEKEVMNKKRDIKSPNNTKILLLCGPFIDLKIRNTEDIKRFSSLSRIVIGDNKEFPLVKLGFFSAAQKQGDFSLREEAEMAMTSSDLNLKTAASNYLKFLGKRPQKP